MRIKGSVKNGDQLCLHCQAKRSIVNRNAEFFESFILLKTTLTKIHLRTLKNGNCKLTVVSPHGDNEAKIYLTCLSISVRTPKTNARVLPSSSSRFSSSTRSTFLYNTNFTSMDNKHQYTLSTFALKTVIAIFSHESPSTN